MKNVFNEILAKKCEQFLFGGDEHAVGDLDKFTEIMTLVWAIMHVWDGISKVDTTNFDSVAEQEFGSEIKAAELEIEELLKAHSDDVASAAKLILGKKPSFFIP